MASKRNGTLYTGVTSNAVQRIWQHREGAVEIIFRGRTAEEIAEHTREYEERFANPFVAASKGFIDEVIMPHSTRRRVALGLRKLRDKQLENPWKKHDNIPL